MLDATPVAKSSARSAQIRAALTDVQEQLEQLQDISGDPDAAPVPSIGVAVRSSAESAEQATGRQAAADTPQGSGAGDDRDGAGRAVAARSESASEAPATGDGGWAARRAAAGAQQRDSLLRRRGTPPVVGAAAQPTEHEVPMQRRPLSNGHAPDLAAETKDNQHASASPVHTPVFSSTPGAASQQAATATANGNGRHGVAAYTALELRRLRVASAEHCRRFDAACFGDDLRKPPDMVPAMPPPAEDLPAVL